MSKKSKGLFIVFDGVDGTGKTTLVQKVEKKLLKEGYKVLLTREPGGTSLGEKVREILLSDDKMDLRTQLLLFTAVRNEHLEKVIYPAVKKGYIVLCDRFIDSSIVYQGDKLGKDEVLKAHYFMETNPADITFTVDTQEDVLLKRLTEKKGRNCLDDRAIDNLKNYRNKYLEIAKKSYNHKIIDNTYFNKEDLVFLKIKELL